MLFYIYLLGKSRRRAIFAYISYLLISPAFSIVSLVGVRVVRPKSLFSYYVTNLPSSRLIKVLTLPIHLVSNLSVHSYCRSHHILLLGPAWDVVWGQFLPPESSFTFAGRLVQDIKRNILHQIGDIPFFHKNSLLCYVHRCWPAVSRVSFILCKRFVCNIVYIPLSSTLSTESCLLVLHILFDEWIAKPQSLVQHCNEFAMRNAHVQNWGMGPAGLQLKHM